MFGLEHFIWLGICAIIIFLFVFLNKKLKFSFYINITAMTIIAIISEFVKISTHIIETEHGFYLDPTALPFHLCSIQIFLIFALRFFVKKEETKNKILLFMFPTMLLGASIALFIPAEGTEFTNPRLYEYFLYHACMVGFALYLITCKIITIDFKAIIRNFAYIVCLAVFALWINSLLSWTEANFMYLSAPPLENLPILNLDDGWFAYIGRIILITIITMTALQLPFAIINYKNNKLIK